jgi:flagellar basal-body rod protein FlgG
MDKGIYTALSGGIAKGHELELISNNLANVNTPGFKKDSGTFNEYLSELRRPDTVESLGREITASTLVDGRPEGDKSFVEMDGVYTDFRQGALSKTSRPLDLAIEGNGFFEVLTPSGPRYTRQGNFNLSNDGILVTAQGFPVLRQGSTNPELRSIAVNEKGPIQISPDGRVLQNNREIAKLSVQEFHETQWLEKVGNSFFRNVDDKNLKPISETKSALHQGFIETSNVNPIFEMTRLIEATRSYESHLQAIKTYQDMDSRSVNNIAK